MSVPNAELARQGGRFNSALGMLLGTADIEKIGEMGIQTLLHFLMLHFYDGGEDLPATGVPRAGFGDPNFLVTAGAGDLDYDVGAGWGIVFDATQLGGDEFSSTAFQMVVSATGFSGTLAAHDPANPRVDLVAVKPLRVGDQGATRNIKDPTTGALSTSGVNLRSRFDGELVVITGVPAAVPADPVLPDGHILLARMEVPASAGPRLIRDARPWLEMGNWMAPAPAKGIYLQDHVAPGVANELLVEEDSPTGLFVISRGGRANIDATTRFYSRKRHAIAAADPVNPRIDIVVARRTGVIDVVTGTPAASPVAPATPGNSIKVAEVAVAALATVVLNADITDTRDMTWLDGGDAVRKATLPHQALTTPPWRIGTVGTSSPTPDVRRFDFAAVYPDGTPWDGAYPLDVLVEVFDATGSFNTFGPGVYDNTNGSTDWYSDHMHSEELPTDFLVFPDGNLENQSVVQAGGTPDDGTNGRFRGKITGAGWAVELCRNTGTTPSGDFYIVVTPLGPGGAPMGPGVIVTAGF